MNDHFTIAIDGPAGAGKTSVARAVAKALNVIYLDTGAMYRAVGLYMLRRGIDPKDHEQVLSHAEEAHVNIVYMNGEQHVYLADEDVSRAIRENAVSAAASAISSVARVRELLVRRQREIARDQSVVMDGRDIGTQVLPNATLKIYLTASPEERARRRERDLAGKGERIPFEQLLREINQRDYDDSHREASPLRQAPDAVLLDSTQISLDDVISRVLALVHERMNCP